MSLAEEKFLEEKYTQLRRLEEIGHIDPSCDYCRGEFYAADSPAYVLAPRHKASDRCESGKRPHCSCDTCF